MTFRVFIDTNIFLSFYELSKDDSVQLANMFTLAGQNEILFISTDQVQNEYFRRRASVISTSLKALNELRIPGIPTMASDLPESKAFTAARKSISEAHKNLVTALNEKIVARQLFADVLIEALFDLSTNLKVEDRVFSLARNRIECGNPPGKRGELGDAINWELLLTLPDDGKELVMVTQDKDYFDPIKPTLNDYLVREWRLEHKGNLTHYASLKDFVEGRFPNVEIRSFKDIDEKINRLAGSRTFAETHAAISELNAVKFFTTKQVNYLINVLSQNNQVNWIYKDPDITALFDRLQTEFSEKLEFLAFMYLAEMKMYDGNGTPPVLGW